VEILILPRTNTDKHGDRDKREGKEDRPKKGHPYSNPKNFTLLRQGFPSW
jgi:hypothetical protein